MKASLFANQMKSQARMLKIEAKEYDVKFPVPIAEQIESAAKKLLDDLK
jgi:hypothetical protein